MVNGLNSNSVTGQQDKKAEFYKDAVTFENWLTIEDRAKNKLHNNNFLALWRYLKDKAETMYSDAQGDLHTKHYGHKLSGMENITIKHRLENVNS